MRPAVLAAFLGIVAGGCHARAGLNGGHDAGSGGDGGCCGADGGVAGDGGLNGCAIGAEICNNGCDDDRNGYTDADDPACTPQLLITPSSQGSVPLQRLLLQGSQAVAKQVDGNAEPANALGAYNGKFAANTVYFAMENGNQTVRKLTLSASGTGTISDYDCFVLNNCVSMRDLCFFNGEMLVVDAMNPLLHRWSADGMTDLGTVTVPGSGVTLDACASDGKYLYVAEHTVTAPGTFVVLDSHFQQVGTPLALPSGLDPSIDRCLDFTWTKVGGFYGLFVNSQGAPNDAQLVAGQITPFNFDGGVGAPIDAGTLHGVGEFSP